MWVVSFVYIVFVLFVSCVVRVLRRMLVLKLCPCVVRIVGVLFCLHVLCARTFLFVVCSYVSEFWCGYSQLTFEFRCSEFYLSAAICDQYLKHSKIHTGGKRTLNNGPCYDAVLDGVEHGSASIPFFMTRCI